MNHRGNVVKTDMDEKKLKTCPFCGGKGRFYLFSGAGKTFVTVMCKSCRSQVGPFEYDEESETSFKGAITSASIMWNMRIGDMRKSAITGEQQ